MKFKKLMLVLTFTVSIIFVTVIGGTYAYYNISSGSISGTTGTVDTGFNVVFNGSNTFNLNVGVPIQSSEMDTKAASVLYSIYTNNIDFLYDIYFSKYDAYVSIDFTNVDMDNELKVSDFKYHTYCHPAYDGIYDSSGNYYRESGTGEDFSGQVFNSSKRLNVFNMNSDAFVALFMLREAELDDNPNSTVGGYRFDCSTYVWLEESGQNQNNLMGKHFGADIEVNTYVKKR